MIRIGSLKFLALGAALFVALAPGPAAAHEGDGPEPKIVESMEEINRGFRKLRRQAADPEKKSSSLELLAAIRANAEISREETPLKIVQGEIPEAEQDAFLNGYREAVDQLLSILDSLKTAIEEENAEKIDYLLEQIYNSKKQGHKKYQSEHH